MMQDKSKTLVPQLQSFPANWLAWWSSRSAAQKILPAVFVSLYWLILISLNGMRQDHLTLGILILLGNYGGAGIHYVYRFLLPVIATAVVYDSQRFYADYIRGPVHVEEPYLFDKRFFGIQTEAGLLTPNEWFALHTIPALDVITGFFYLTFVPIFVAIGGYFYFIATKSGTAKLSASELQRQVPKFMWSFFWVNLIGYTTYYWYAAAPPWYVALHGLGPARMDTLANAAGCVRFDQILGTKFFTEWYGRSADVFGAIPSLHVAYPLQAVFFSFKFGKVRAFSLFFYLIMCFSAVYLNHHYVLDVMLGSLYAIVVTLVVDWYFDKKFRSPDNLN